MTIPSFTVPYIFWRSNKTYGQRKVCITGGSFIPGEYLKGNRKPNYPMPAIRALVNNAQRLITFGEITAENGFDIPTVFERFVKLK